MKRKQFVTLIIMIAAIVLLAAGYTAVMNMNSDNADVDDDGQQEEEVKTIHLFEINADDVIGISYSCDLGSLDMTKESGMWLQKGTSVPINDEQVSVMLDAVNDVVAIREIEDGAGNLGEYGLENPSMQYTITMSDNTTHIFKFGLKLQTQIEGYYALIDSSDKVYSVAANYFDPFHKSLEEMIAIEDEINISVDNVTKFGVTTNKGLNFAASYVGDEIEENTYYTWRIDEPYDNVMADTDSLKEILANLANLKYESCVAYSEEDMSQYGLEKPFATLSLEYYEVTGVETPETGDEMPETGDEAQGTDEQAYATPVPEEMRVYSTYALNIGDSYSEGEDKGYYVNPEGSSNVYRMDSMYIDALTGFTSFSLADPCIYTVLVDQMTGYEIEYEGEKIVVERKQENEEDVYYVNGKKVEKEGILTLFSAAYLLTFSGEADDEKAELDSKPVLKITYHTNGGKDDVVKYIPYDGDNFYQVDKNGINYFLTDKRGIDDLISRYKTYMKENF